MSEGFLNRRNFLKGAAAAGAAMAAGGSESDARGVSLEGAAGERFENEISDKLNAAFAGKLLKIKSLRIKILGGGADAFKPLLLGVYDDRNQSIGEIAVPSKDRGMLINRVIEEMVRNHLEAKGLLR